jgi:hypothetical protein
VVYDEGLRSYRAIVFIATKCKNRVTSGTISYLKSGASSQKTVLTKKVTPSGFSRNLGEKKLWIK